MLSSYPVRAVLVGLLALAAFEVGARRFGWLDPTEKHDVYLGFPGTSPLYRLEERDGREVRALSPNKSGAYLQLEFPAEKPEDELRVFCIGGSSVRSGQMESAATFPELLELFLDELHPGRPVDVINAGGAGTGSIQNLEVVREVLDYDADLVVVYPEGGEKNVIPPSPQAVLAAGDDASPLRVAARRILTKSRAYLGLRDLYRELMPSGPGGDRLRGAYSAIALYAISRPFVEETFTRIFDIKVDNVPVLMEHPVDDEIIAAAHARFERNLREMARLARERDVPLLFVLPLRNPKASFNLRFHIDPDEIRDGELDRWRESYEAGVAAKREGRNEEAIEHFLAVRSTYVEDTDEILAFYLGQCYEALGRHDEALAEYSLPALRHPMRECLLRVGAEEDVPVLDPYPDLCAAADGRVPGYNFFIDSFHPTPETNAILARSMLGAIRDEGMLELSDEPPRSALAKVESIVERFERPAFHYMHEAMLAGDAERAAKIGRTIPASSLQASPVTPLYLGWALTRAGRIDEAREVWQRMHDKWGDNVRHLPDLSTPEAIVKNAFNGDIWAWF